MAPVAGAAAWEEAAGSDRARGTLVDVLLARAAAHPERTLYRFLTDGEAEGESLTYGELDRRARALAAWLTERGLAGERALLLYPPGLEFVAAFLGCLYAGVIAVPAYPPRANRTDGRLQAIARDARPRLALTTAALRDRAAALVAHNPALSGVEWLATAALDTAALAPLWRPEARPSAAALAFLQYTSGSTATPKGVAVHHANLVHNEGLIERAFGQSAASVIVGWLPLYHDMGLIGNVLQPLWLGATCVLMAPVAFLQRPRRWLEAIDRYRATTSGGPNFAYDLCVQKIAPAERQGLDLASWTVAFNGAEPVAADTLDRFAAAFAPCGFRRSAFLPCYGLAEATLLVSGAGDDDGDDGGREPAIYPADPAALAFGRAEIAAPGVAARPLVSCGAAGPGVGLAIVDPAGAALPEGTVGEIWVAGPSVAGGYWGRPEETAATFGARLAGAGGGEEGGEGEWLRTGDLGFIAGGELFVTGRQKDLIILRGRNLYPQDVEATAAASHPGLRRGGGAAFSIDEGGEERLVLVQEVERETERGWLRDPAATAAALAAIRRAVAEEHEAALHALVLVRAGAVPKTSSGKVRRRDSRADFLAGRLTPLCEWAAAAAEAEGESRAPAGAIESRLESLVAQVLGRDAVAVEHDLFALGLDSLKAIELLARVREAFGVELALDELLAASTVAGLAELLADLLTGPPAGVAAEPPLVRRDAAAGLALPLSFAQRRLWFLDRLEPGNPVHNLAAALRLTGRLRVPALAAALAEIVRRHEALRTAFVIEAGDARDADVGDEPVQRVLPPAPLALPAVDLAGLPAGLRPGVAAGIARTLGRLPFDLAAGRVVRAALLRLAERQHELVLAFHHIAADGGSFAVLAGEIAALYGAFSAGHPSPLPELPVQYADYALWQRRRATEAALAPGLAWWRARLAGPLPPLELPADRPRPALLSYRGAHLERPLGAEVAARLAAVAAEARATPVMALLTGFAVLLHRATGEADLLLGAPVAGRDRLELSGLLGVFLNNLPLRLGAAGKPGFAELLGRVREALLGALAHQEVPFERLVDELGLARDLSRTPLFQLLFVGQNAPLSPIDLPGLHLAPREVDLGAARFDLALSLAPAASSGNAGWLGTWKFSTDLFDAATVARFAAGLENLLAAGLAEPARPVGELAWLGEAERHQVLAGFNDTARVYPEGDRPLHGLILEQAARTPLAVALEFGDLRLDYRELLGEAGALAGRLCALGVGAESRVGIATLRSPEMVVGLLGILLAGAAYVPLDPDYPAERLAAMLEDAAVDALLAQEGMLPRLGPAAERLAAAGRVLALARETADPIADPPGAAHAVDPGHPAYAIFTSGSTGRPKGAVVPHRGIVNRLLWMQEAYRLGPADRVLQKTPFSFDVSVWEFFWPLLTGARLVVAPPGAHQDPAWLLELIDRHRITTLHFVPSLLQVFLEQPGVERAAESVRQVFASGEALPFDLAERFLARLPGVALHNLYGPTEASVDVTYHACVAGDGRRAVPIGRPIANTAIVLLDGELAPVPVGIPGELYIGGTGLARGYLDRPALTAERFVPDPWPGEPGARLYRTGDLARFRPDGEVEFLGRLDHQVKVRGVRIELGEIEAALATHAAVREAVVLARSRAAASGSSEVRLIAFLVPAAGAAPPTADELRAHLRQSLPEAMVPSSFAVLESFPLTGSGKTDRRALAALPLAEEMEPAASQAAFAEPEGELERRLAELWSELLQIRRVGRHDNFFELGGDSIQGAMLVNRIQRELGEIVYVMALFDAPTVAALSAHLAARYPEAVSRWVGVAPAVAAAEGAADGAPDLTSAAGVEAALGELRAAVSRRLGERGRAARTAANPPAVFLLSPFRSGSTLLRVMLAGHPRLFAPPELELLAFDTLGERRRIYSGRDGFAREGLLRAVMELCNVDADGAEAIVGAAEAQDLPVGRWYGQLQEWAGGRLLVDKTPSYALDPATLARAEELFDRPLYVHLLRHPAATTASYVEARMDQVYAGFPFAPATQAELVWLLAHENIGRFLAGIPAERQYRLRFEDLLADPRREMAALGDFLGVGFAPGMLEPYAGGRMTDGPRAGSRMMGDPKFLAHQGIDAGVARRSRGGAGEAGLVAERSRELAARLGYPTPPLLDTEASSLTLLPVPRDGRPLPLSFAQERLWFLAQLDPESPAYNMPAAAEIRGPLDAGALARSFAVVRRRHEVLRTRFPVASGHPVLAVDPAPTPAEVAAARLAVVDLTGLAEGARQAEARALALAEGRRPFDLAAGPMLRTTLLALGEGEHRLLVTLHHIVSDGWTIGVLMRELGILYGAFAAGHPSPLPELPLQYADYAWHQRRWLSGEAMAGHLAFWRRRLAGPLPPLELPADRPRPPVLTRHGARLSRTLPAAATEAVRAAGTAAGATFFLAVLAAWNTLLRRYTGQDDLLLGIPIANRNRFETEGLIGVFLNMVVQRTSTAGDPLFGRLLAAVKDGFLASIPHQEVPFERLVEELQPERDLSRAPIFQIQFSLQNTPSEPLALPGLAVELLENHNRTTKFDLTVFLFDLAGGLTTTLEYNTDLFDEATMARLLGHWQGLLEAAGAASGMGVRLSEMPLLAAAERDELLTRGNARPAEFPVAATLPEIVARQAALRPNAVAAVCELAEITYGRLDSEAGRLAAHLRALGVGPEVRVGLCAERSLDLVVGILGILKAGGAYVPLDPAYPAERLAFLLDDALGTTTAPVLVTQAALADRFAHLPYQVVTLGAVPAAPPEAVAALGAGAVGPAAAAYVIYTSGSTGRPKGVVVSHAQVVRLFTATEEWFGFGPDDVWTLFHSFAFDFSVWEIWGALLHGGCLVVVPRAIAVSPSELYDLLATERVTVLSQTPSAFRQLVAHEGEEGMRRLHLRHVVFGGEALDLAALAPWMARHGDARPALINMYGITETTVHVTYRPVVAADLARPGASPVGVPIPDLSCHLLGQSGELLPVGVPGEIHVGGAGVTRGYLGRPELTAERFVPDPFAGPDAPGARLYRSGDLARRRPDGDLDYLGRIDGQVKIRGFRIELGEIEAALARHSQVREAVVLTRRDAQGNGRLAAWVLARGAAVPAAELRAHLQGLLPDYMVPATFVVVDRWPLTAHGKLDRRALPDTQEEERETFAAPRTPLEEALARIWAEVLGRERVGIDESFFEIGGHSLLATQVMSRVRAALGVELPLRRFFETPTVAGLAEALAGTGAAVGEGSAAAPPLARRPPGEAPPLSFAQQRLWFLDRLEPGGYAYNIAFAFRLEGPLDRAALAAALTEVVRRHEALRTRFAEASISGAVSGSEGVEQVVAPPPAEWPLPWIDLGRLAPPVAAREAGRLADQAARQPFDLAAGPLLRTLLLEEGPEVHRLSLAVHHAVADGWSVGVFFRELAALYGAAAGGRAADLVGVLPELPIQYADYSLWQRRRLSGAVLEAELGYWRGHLAGAPEALELPADRPRPPRQSYRGAVRRFPLGRALSAAVEALAQRLEATPFMVFLAAFGALLSRHAGQREVVVGTPIANRGRQELEPIIGFFANTLALRVDLAGDPAFATAVERAREVALGGYAHQDTPFEMVVEAVQPKRDLSRSPLFQAMLVLQNAPAEEMAIAGLHLTPLPPERTIAKFDLTLFLESHDGGLVGTAEYATELFDATTIDRLSAHFTRLLAGAAAAPERPLGSLPLLSPGERHQLEVEWNDRQSPYEAAVGVAELVAAEAARHPDAPAFVAGGREISYGELDRQAGQMAHRLREAGAQPGSLIALLGERDLDLWVAVLAVWKAGGAYLPLDPHHPPARQRQILAEGRPILVAAAAAFVEPLKEVLAQLPPENRPGLLSWEGGVLAVLAVPYVLGGEEEKDLKDCKDCKDESDPAREGAPANALAYVIFTSGSTGVPKGAMVEGRGMVNHLWAKVADLGLTAADVVAQTASQGFDISVWQVWSALAAGGRMLLYPDAVAHDPALLLAATEADGVTVLETVPSLLRAMLEEARRLGAARPRLGALRWMLATGEALPPELCREWAELYPAIPLLNAYGPTECSDDVTHHVLRGGEAEAAAPIVPIGRPVANTRIHLLDGILGSVPIGVGGEIWVGGDGVGWGYLHDPVKTALAFRPDPLAGPGAPGARLYRTGDLGRQLSGGEILFLGRIDQQVKVRGFRIELGEVEAAVAAYPAVAEAVAIVRPDPAGARLVAFVTAAEGGLDLAELRAFVKGRLPESMTPSAFVALDSMPRTPNGKTDRAALAARSDDAVPVLAYVPPGNAVEELLAGIFGAVLGLPRVGIHDDFFDLGGHSLLATQVVARVRAALGVELPLGRLFEAPTVAGLAAVVGALRRGDGALEAPPLARRAEAGPAPLSFAQQRLWFLDQLEPSSNAYNLAGAFRFTGALAVPVLAAALDRVVRRHEALRTRFVRSAEGAESGPVQEVVPAGDWTLPEIDLSALPDGARAAAADRATLTVAQRPFDLAAGPLLRIALLDLGGDTHRVAFAMHHTISDGWSLGVFEREVARLYAAAVAGEDLATALPELPIQYADYAAWQRGWLAGPVLARELDYWRGHLAGAPEALELPADRPRPARQSFRGATRRLALPADLTAGVGELGRRLGATPFMVLLAALGTLLSRLSGQGEVVVGTPIANRGRMELEPLIGFFANTLALRLPVEAPAAPAFAALVDRVRGAALGGYAHQDVPFEAVVEAVNPRRDLSRSPLFQVLFALQNAPFSALSLPGVTLAPLAMDLGRSAFDLGLSLEPQGDGLTAVLDFNRDLFDPATAARWLTGFATLLQGALAAPEGAVGDLPLQGEGERWQVLHEWNATAAAVTPWPAAIATLHGPFAHQAALKPDALALAGPGSDLSYAELERRSNRLAHHLLALGVEPEARVGLLVSRSAEMVVALLAILKAGGAYVPLDPSHPAERRALVLGDAGVAVVVTEERHAAGLEEALPGGVPRLLLDRDRETIAARPATAPAVALDGDNLAYVLFTSGSTGKPKGVALAHRAVLSFLAAMAERPGLAAGEALPALTTLTFDIAGLEIYLPLSVGGRVEVVARAEGADGRLLAARLAASRVAAMQATPATWRLLLDAGWTGEPGMVALSGGEALPPDLAAALLARAAGVWNLYGPTETAVWSAVERVTAEGLPGRAAVSLGRPIASTRMMVADRAFAAVPLGAAGELLIGGPGVARGYHGRPELTAERFVPDPWSGEGGARLYRTGDLVRHRAGGELDYLGRIDHQVKVRGFRIEPGEVEAALLGHAGVGQAVVVALGEGAERRLAAYWVPAGSEKIAPPAPHAIFSPVPTAAELRQHLRGAVPDYMVPSVFVELAELPLSPSGKVDRRRLPAPAAQEGGEAAGPPPRTPLEQLLAGIWAEVLGREPQGVGESFFDLGGHSLLATQVLARVRSAAGVEVALAPFFEAPTVAGLAALVAAAGSAGLPAAPPPTRRADGGPAPLSFAQERLWFLDRLAPGSDAYNLAGALRLGGPLAVPALAAALARVVRRHEALRTRFALDEANGGPVQEILPPGTWEELPAVDLSRLPDGARLAAAAWVTGEVARRPFDLAHGPLLRVVLIALAPAEHRVAFAMHHTISDGWSMGLFVREMAALYGAAAGRRAPAAAELRQVPDLPLQYADYAVWQRRWLTGEVLERHLDYWRTRLAGATEGLELPTDRPRPPVQSFAGGAVGLALSPAAAAAVRGFARASGATLFMTLLAGLAALLSRHTGQSRLAIGTPIANRQRTELEGLIGFFANTLVLALDAPGERPFADLLAEARVRSLEAQAHQELPFEKLVEELRPERDLSRGALFQVLLAAQNVPAGRIELPGLAVEPLGLAEEPAQFDLNLYVDEREGLTLRLVYATALFDRTTAIRLLGHYARLLEEAAADPGMALGRLPLLSDGERRQLADWSADTAVDFGPFASLPQRIAARAALRPGETAVVFGDERIAYGELIARAHRLAARLRALGVGPESPVGLCLGRSVEMVVAILGTLAAGGAYVPLDPAYPAERLAYMLEDSAVAVLLTQRRLVATLPPYGGAVVVLDEAPDSGDAEGAGAAAGPFPVPVDRQGLAYVIYTSGSTGRPKGAMNSHGALANRLRWMQAAYPLGPGDRVLQKTPFSFDVSVWEFLWPLAEGARLVVAEPGGHLDPAYLAGLIESAGVTTLHFVPAMLQAFLDQEGLREKCRTVRQVIASGEALPAELARRFFARLPGELYNLYGPTEAAIDVSAWACRPDDDRASVPIGRPIANLALFVADRELRPVPVGVAGELLIGGAGLARGYWRRPELTAERFVPDPISGGAGERLYRTGDLARWKPAGEIDYLGRLDFQVKVRGVRIELGEIEAALAREPQVREAVVAARPAAGGLRLVAYVVPAPGAAVDAGALSAALSRTLPEALVPAAFVALAALPLSPNGKVDRKALPEPAWRGEEGGQAPATPVEEVLAAIWAELLDSDRLPARDDSFFELGGHSLLGTRVMSRLAAAFAVELPLHQLFETPTLAGLAAAVEAARAAGGRPPAPAIRPADRQEPIPLAYAQERLWFLDQLERGRGLYALPFAVRLRGALEPAVLAACLDEIVRRHEILRTRFVATGGRPVQVIDPDWRPALPLIDLSALGPAGAAERQRLVADVPGPTFDLAAGKLLRALLLRDGEGDHTLAVVLHHIVTDGWSTGLLSRELAALYPAFARGLPSPLPELAVQYADFAVWQREWLSGETLAGQLAYWTGRLAGLPRLALPTDRPPAASGVLRAGSLPVELPAALSAELYAFARRRGASPYMVLMAAFQAFLHRLTGQDDIAVGSPIANRNRAEIEPLIGFFVNTLVLRTGLADGPSFAEALERVRSGTLGAYEHQDLPFSLLVEALQPDRRAGAVTLVDALFALQNQPAPVMELPGLALEPLARAADAGLVTQYAVVLVLWDSAERPGALAGSLSYDATLLDPTTAVRWEGHWQRLLAAAIASPDLPLCELPLLAESERHQVLYEEEDGEVVLVDGAPAPLGVWGEVCRPAAGGAWERTGRRARRLADGSLEEAATPELLPTAAAVENPPAEAVDREEVGEARAELSRRRDELSAAKRELLAKRLRRPREGGQGQ